MKPENLRRWTIHIRPLSDVSVSRNWYETVSNLYENSYIYAILYKSCSIKQIIINKYANQSENGDIPQEPENFRFAQHDPIHEVTDPIYITTPLQEPQKCTVMYDLLQTDNSSNAPDTSLTIATALNHLTAKPSGSSPPHSNLPLRTQQQHWGTEILPLSVLPNHENWFLWLLRPLWPPYLTDWLLWA